MLSAVRIKRIVALACAMLCGKVPVSPAGFELFGFDILVDAAMKPWLIEVNCSPALNLDTPVDREVKFPLLTDTFSSLALHTRSFNNIQSVVTNPATAEPGPRRSSSASKLAPAMTASLRRPSPPARTVRSNSPVSTMRAPSPATATRQARALAEGADKLWGFCEAVTQLTEGRWGPPQWNG